MIEKNEKLSNEKFTFFKQKEEIEEYIKASHDPIKEWHQDPKGYFLIRINKEEKRIEVAYVKNDHKIKKVFYGDNAMDLYHTIKRHELITRMEHAAYLGKELYKAELALQYNLEYIQEEPLKLPLEKKHITSKES